MCETKTPQAEFFSLSPIMSSLVFLAHFHPSVLLTSPQFLVRGLRRQLLFDRWTFLDMPIIFLYFVGFGIRVAHKSSSYDLISAKSLFATVSFLLIARFSRFYEFFQGLGPKVRGSCGPSLVLKLNCILLSHEYNLPFLGGHDEAYVQ